MAFLRVTVSSVQVELYSHNLATTGLNTSGSVDSDALDQSHSLVAAHYDVDPDIQANGVSIPYGVTAVYDDNSEGHPVFWDRLSVAEGKFGTQEGLVLVENELAEVSSWTDSKITFLPRKGSLESTASYDVHVYRPT